VASESQKIATSFHILTCIWFLHSKSYFLGERALEDCLFVTKQQNMLKFKYHLAVASSEFRWGEAKKDKSVARNGIELCFEV
jgi:hypothetical protein